MAGMERLPSLLSRSGGPSSRSHPLPRQAHTGKFLKLEVAPGDLRDVTTQNDPRCSPHRWSPNAKASVLPAWIQPCTSSSAPPPLCLSCVGFKFRTSPSQNHRISFTVMTSSPLREGDVKWHIRGYIASVSCLKCPSCGLQYSRLLLYSRQLEILSGGKNLRRGKLAFRRVSQPDPPFTN